MSSAPQICLGTVQFGLSYGVTNKSGQVPEEEVCKILELAAASGVNMLDTAQGYGTAETITGRCWPKGAPRQVISKLKASAPRHSWEKSLKTSLQRLNTPSLDGFLVHRASDLLGPEGAVLLNWLEGLRKRKLVKRIGVSIYEASDIDNLPIDRLQLVQIPLSVFDQRLIHDGTVKKLQEQNIAIHARSVLLQGLLVQPPQAWPDHLSPAFREHYVQWLIEVRQQGLTPLGAALGFMRTCTSLEAVLIGVQSLNEFAEVIKTWNQANNSTFKGMSNWYWENVMDLDPRCWPKR